MGGDELNELREQRRRERDPAPVQIGKQRQLARAPDDHLGIPQRGLCLAGQARPAVVADADDHEHLAVRPVHASEATGRGRSPKQQPSDAR